MKYYIIKTNIKDIGVSPQNKVGKLDIVHIKDSQSFRNLEYSSVFQPKIGTIELHHRAKLTDVLNITNFMDRKCLIISERFKNLLKSIKVLDYSLFPVDVVKNNKSILNYYILKFNTTAGEFINFEESLIIKIDNKTNEESRADYTKGKWLNLFNQDHLGLPDYRYYYKLKKIVFTGDFDIDLFNLNSLEINSFGSQRFVDFVKANEITGITCDPFESS